MYTNLAVMTLSYYVCTRSVGGSYIRVCAYLLNANNR
jgi:hypothetical protein